MKAKTQKSVMEYLASPGVESYFYKGKAARSVAEKLASKGLVIHEPLRHVSIGRHNRKWQVSGRVSLPKPRYSRTVEFDRQEARYKIATMHRQHGVRLPQPIALSESDLDFAEMRFALWAHRQ